MSGSGFLPPKRPRFNPKRPSRNDPLLHPATRRDVFEISKAMVNTVRAIDAEFETIHARMEYLRLPFWRRWFATWPEFPDSQNDRPSAELSDKTLDHDESIGDTSTATDGSEGPESPEEL